MRIDMRNLNMVQRIIVKGEGSGRMAREETYEVCKESLQELATFLHLILGTPQLHNVTLLGWVWEIDDDLEGNSPESAVFMQSLIPSQGSDSVRQVSTSGNFSRTSLIFSPFWPMMVRWNFCSIIRSLVRSFSCV